MLKDLKMPVARQKSELNVGNMVSNKEQVDKDYDAACDIINNLFRHLNDCLNRDRSRVKINLFAKGYIQFILKDKVRDGILDFVKGMYPEDMKLLMDDMERDVLKRKK